MHLNVHVSKLSILDGSGAAGSYMYVKMVKKVGVENIFGEALNGCTTTDMFLETINLIQILPWSQRGCLMEFCMMTIWDFCYIKG